VASVVAAVVFEVVAAVVAQALAAVVTAVAAAVVTAAVWAAEGNVDVAAIVCLWCSCALGLACGVYETS